MQTLTTTEAIGKYRPLQQIIHWTVALFVICQLAMGCVLGQLRSLQYGQAVMSLHRQMGFAVLLICIVRLILILRHRTPAIGAALPRWQRIAARGVHAGFYIAMIVQPLFGLLVAWARGDTVTAFGLIHLPEPWDISDSLRDVAMTAHIVTAAALLSLMLVHVAAVLFNHRKRVPVLDRMLPSTPPNTLVNRISVPVQLLSALGFVIAIALAVGINAVIKYRDLTAMTASYQETDLAAADEARSAQTAWKEIVGLSGAGLSDQVADRLRSIADTAVTHLDGGAQQLIDPTAKAAIADVAALIRPLSEGKESFTPAVIAAVDTRLQDLLDAQAASDQQRVGEIAESASRGHDLIVVTVAPMVLVGLVLAVLLARSMSSAIGRMRSLVRGVEANETSGDIVIFGRGEFALLMTDMVSMQAAVQQRMQREADARLAIEHTLRDALELRVLERTAELSQKTADVNAMLNNMNLGVSTVVPGNRIHPEFSSYLRTIFNVDHPAGKDIVECLFDKSSLGVDQKDQISVALGAILGEDAMMFEFNSHLLAREMRLDVADGTHKTVQMGWSPIICDQGTVDKVLLITQDVTQLRELEASSAQQKEELDTISRIIRVSVAKFANLLESTRGFIAANRRLIDQNEKLDAEVVAALFRNMHTIKGNARMFNFTHLTNAAHNAERTYDRLRQDAAAAWEAGELRMELDAVDAAMAHYAKVSEDTLGRKGRASDLLTMRGAFVGNDELAELRSMAAALAAAHPGSISTRWHKTIDQLGLLALPRLIEGSIDSLASISAELNKPTPSFEIVNGEIAFNGQFAETLKSCLIHILRNSLDHGIEAPADRVLAGKPGRGSLRFVCDRNGDRVELLIGDDGRGLALHALYAKGLASGIYAAADRPTRQTVADVIFRAGVSTAAAVTDISGRGVGMDAVRTFLGEQSATIRVVLDEPLGTKLDFAPFAFVISLPPSAFRHADSEDASGLVRDVREESTLSDASRVQVGHALPNVA